MSQFCQQSAGLSDEQYWRGFSKNVLDLRVPFSGSLELTRRCNLGCVHCYDRAEAGEDPSSLELSAERWKELIGEIKEAGCLYLLLTGGEPLLRQDFPEIYAHAKRNGFLVTVFTNGTLVSDRISELFRELPPRLVEISLYGASAETHDRITGIPGSFQQARQGIAKLSEQEIPVGLKSMLMTLNASEMPAIEGLARDLGLKFRLDAALFPTFDGDRSPLDLRVPPRQAVEQEFSDPGRAQEAREFFARYRGVRAGNSVYTCGAGMTTFHVDAQGYLHPCVMANRRRYSLEAGFPRAWDGSISRIREDVTVSASECRDCEKKLLCGYCPGLFELENGHEQSPSEYLCSLGKLRYEYITQGSFGG